MTTQSTTPTLTITTNDSALNIGDDATITLTFTAAPAVLPSITASSGTLGDFTVVSGSSDLIYTATLTPPSTSTATISFIADSWVDATGNSGSTAAADTVAVDTIAPTVVIATDDSALKVGDVATLTFTLSESSTNFAAADVTVTGGTLSGFTGSGTSYTASFTPTASSTTAATIDVSAAKFTDAAVNSNTGATQLSLSVDTVAPTLTVSGVDISDDNGTSATDFITDAANQTITGTLSSALDSGDILYGSVDNGSNWTDITNMVNSTGINWKGATLPASSSIVFKVIDAAGNTGSSTGSQAYVLDVTAPTVAITTNDSALKIGDVATLTFTLSETSTDFTSADVTVAGGTLGTMSGSGTSYTASFTPDASSTTAATVNVIAANFTDAAGNDNAAATQLSMTVDTIAPTVAITTNDNALKIGDVATLTFTLSEASTNFAAVDVTVTGGTLGTMSGSGTSYSASFTPTASSTTSATINVSAANFTDAAGNSNTAATQLSMTVDTVAPTLAITSNDSVLNIGDSATITLTFTEAPASLPTITASSGSLGAFTPTTGSNYLIYTATLTPPSIASTATFSFSAASWTDAAGNSGSTASAATVTVDTVAPTLAITTNDSVLSIGDDATITLTFSETPASLPTISASQGTLGDFTVSSGSSGLIYTATLTPPDSVSAATISFTAGSWFDTAENSGSTSSAATVAVDTVAPTLIVSGLKLSADTGPSAADFITYTAAQTITGTLSSTLTTGDIVYGSVDNGSSWTNITTLVSGTAISWTGATISGSSSITFKVVDAAGNTGSSTGSQAYVLDVTAPTPTVSGIEISADKGSSDTDFITNTAAQTITGTLSSTLATGDILYGSVDNGSSWTDISTAVNGNAISWTDAALYGSSSIAFKVGDAAGNSVSSTSQAYVLDLIDPSPPALALTTDSGTKTDSITNSGLLTISGQETGATFEYCIDGKNWSDSFVAKEGANVVQVRQIDVAGNVSVESAGLNFTLDTQIIQLTLSLANDTAINGDQITSDATVSLSNVEADATVAYSIDAGITWKSSFTAVEGANQVQVRQTDVAGNVSTATDVLSFTLDTKVAIPALGLDSDTGSSSTDGISSSGKIDVSAIEAGASWRYSSNTGRSWTQGTGDSFVLAEGSYAADAIQVEQTDAAGNINSIANAGIITIDHSVPARPSVALASDTGIATDKISSKGLLAIIGQDDNHTVQYSIDGSTWSSSFTAVEGNNAVWVHQTNLAGNISDDSEPLSFTLDTQITPPTMALVNDSATAGDQITNDARVRFEDLEDGATIQYSLDAGKSWISESEIPLVLIEGTNSILVHQTDVAGNISAATSYSFMFDKTVLVPALSLLNDSGISGSDNLTNNKTLVVAAEAGATIEYTEDGTIWRTEYALSEGSNSVFVRQTDAAGNQSAASIAYQFTLDTEAAKLTLSLTNDTGTDDDHITTNASLSFVGLEDGATVQYSIDSGKNWSDSFSPKLGANKVAVHQTDLAGNVSAASDALDFTLLSDGSSKFTDLLAFSWKAHSLLNAVNVTIGTTQAATDNNGAATVFSDAGGATVITATRAVASSETAATNDAVNLQDAIAILKMIVGLPVNSSGQALSPYQAFAADYDGNGKVELSDAISVLKHVVGLTAPAPQWLFFNEADSNVPGDANLTPGLMPALTIDSTMPTHIGLVGVLRGDVDGSFAGTGMPVMTDSRAYFTDLVAAHPVLNLAQFGVYPQV